MINRSGGAENAFTNQNHKTSRVHFPRGERTNIFPNSSSQGNVHIQEMLDSAVGFLKAQNVRFFCESLEVLQFVFTAGGVQTK